MTNHPSDSHSQAPHGPEGEHLAPPVPPKKKGPDLVLVAIGLAILAILIAGTALLLSSKDEQLTARVGDLENNVHRHSGLITEVTKVAKDADRKASQSGELAEDAMSVAMSASAVARKCASSCGGGKKAVQQGSKPKKPVVRHAPVTPPPHAPAPVPVTTPAPAPASAPAPAASKACEAPCETHPILKNVERTEDRADGHCVIILDDGGKTKYARFDQFDGNDEFFVYLVTDKVGETQVVPHMRTLVGFDKDGKKGTVALKRDSNGKYDCDVAVNAFKIEKYFSWTAPRLGLGANCKVVAVANRGTRKKM
jgi:hypothetical protein